MAGPNHENAVVIRLLVWLFAITALIVAVVQINEAGKEGANAPAPSVKKILPKVTVQSVSLVDHTAGLKVLARVNSRYSSEVSSVVNGLISNLSARFMVGADVQKGDVLMTIDAAAWRASVAEAEHALAQARVVSAEERRDVEQARAEWKLRAPSSQQQPTPLYLREPQAEVARLAEQAALASLESARKQLADAVIRAPFNATVVSRNVGPGESVSAGQVVAELASNDESDTSPLPDVGTGPVSDTGSRFAGVR